MKITDIKTKKAAQEILNNKNKFNEFVVKNKNYIHSVISKIKNIENYSYDDLYQEALIALYSALKTYNPEEKSVSGKKIANFSTYSYYLMRNEVLHYVSKMNKITTNENSIENYKLTKHNNNDNSYVYDERKFLNKKNSSFEDAIIEKVDNENIMRKLSPIEKTIFQKKIIENCNHDEVAKALKMPTATYMAIYYRSFIPKLKSIGYNITALNKKNKTIKVKK